MINTKAKTAIIKTFGSISNPPSLISGESVLSRNKFLSIKREELRISQEYMKKLNLRKIRWILREMKKGELSVYQIAKLQNVSQRWVRQLPRKYANIPFLGQKETLINLTINSLDVMTMNIGKAFGLAKLPVLAIIGLGLLASLISVVPIVQFLMCLLGLPLLIISIILYAYIGYLIAKGGLEIVDSAAIGALTALVSGVIGMIISLVASMLGMGVDVATGGDVASSALGVGIGVIASIIGIIIKMIIGAVIAVIGHIIGGAAMKK